MKKNYFLYFIALLLFGTNGCVASLIHLDSSMIVLLRTLIGSVFLFGIFLIKREPFTFHHYPKSMLFLTLSGLCMGISWMFIYEAYNYIGVSLASLCNYSSLILVMVASVIIFKERLTFSKVIGFIIVVSGMMLINENALHERLSSHGLFLGMMACLFYALMIIFNKKAAPISGIENATIQLFMSFLVTAFFVIFKKGFTLDMPAGDTLPIFILGIVNTGIGCYFYFSCIGKLPTSTVAICDYLELLSAIIFATIFLGERLTFIQTLGACMIIGGAIFANLFDKRRQAISLSTAH